MNEACRREVVSLHRFFEDWFMGRLAPERFGSVSEVLAEQFEIVQPSGLRTGRAELLEKLQQARGCHTESEPPFSIRIAAFSARPLADNVRLVTYEEWQLLGGRETGRLSTAVFGRQHEAPNGVQWLHVHEVWLPGSP